MVDSGVRLCGALLLEMLDYRIGNRNGTIEPCLSGSHTGYTTPCGLIEKQAQSVGFVVCQPDKHGLNNQP